MSILQNLLGNATQAEASQYESIISPMLVPNEKVAQAYKILRDLIVFTNERLIMVNVQGLSGKRKEITSIPYSQISVFSKESAGTLDLNCEIKLYVRGYPIPVVLQFGRDSNIDVVYRVISEHVLPVL